MKNLKDTHTGSTIYFSFTDWEGDEINRLNKMRKFVHFFNGCSHVLDIGCGRGEFLQALKEKNIKAYGIDRDPACVRRCKEKGLPAEIADVKEYLDTYKDIYDGIMCSHMIEHFYPEDVQNLLIQCYKALKKPGLLLIVTPNPKSLSVIADMFWRDPTHIRPYPLDLLQVFLKKAGFKVIQSGSTNKPPVRGLKGLLRYYILKEYLQGTSLFVLARKE